MRNCRGLGMSKKEESEVYAVAQQEFCKLYGIDFEKVKVLNEKIISLIGSGLGRPSLLAIRAAYSDINQNMDYWTKMWHLSNDPEEMKKKPQQKSFLDLFLYMLLVEGVVTRLVELISFILIENDHDLYDTEGREFVKRFETLYKITLFTKLQFIEKHGFNLLSDAVDRKLRNSIAHIDFAVSEEGRIYDKKTKAYVDDLEERTNYLGGVLALILNVINYSLEKIDAIEK